MDEIELTYLAKELPAGLGDCKSKEMLDIYIPTQGNHPALRIRKQGDRIEITKKIPKQDGDASHLVEMTIPLTLEEYAELATLKGKRVQKTRYYYEADDVVYEIDVFGGDLAGLVLVDVEFPSLERKAAFVPPHWCLCEVTQEEFIAGGKVAGKKYSDIAEQLKPYGYVPLTIS